MVSDKLITLLEFFSAAQLTLFRKYLCSPFFNENEELLLLFDQVDTQVRQRCPEGHTEARKLTKQSVWKILYGNQPFNDAKLRRLASELTQHGLSFLAMEDHRSDPLHEITHTLPRLNSPGLTKHFRGLLRQSEKLSEKSGLRNGAYHLNRFHIEHCAHQFREGAGQKHVEFQHLEQADFHLDCFYITQKLKHYCDALDYKNFRSDTASIQLFPSFLDHLQDSRYLKEISVNAYYLVARMRLEPSDESHYRELKALLNDNHRHFPRRELRALYSYLMNYCIDTHINAGHKEYFHELFDLFRIVIEHEIIIENGTIKPQIYKNIITVGLHIKAFSWVEWFIERYTEMLPKDQQENAYTYNLAKVYFHQRQYHKVIEQLREVEYKSQVYALGGKLMLLKTYFELDEFLALDSLIDSFRIYLRRNRNISREVRQQYLNVLRFAKKLSRVSPYDQEEVKKVRQQIEHCNALAAKSWLLEKVDALG